MAIGGNEDDAPLIIITSCFRNLWTTCLKEPKHCENKCLQYKCYSCDLDIVKYLVLAKQKTCETVLHIVQAQHQLNVKCDNFFCFFIRMAKF